MVVCLRTSSDATVAMSHILYTRKQYAAALNYNRQYHNWLLLLRAITPQRCPDAPAAAGMEECGQYTLSYNDETRFDLFCSCMQGVVCVLDLCGAGGVHI